MGYSTQRGKKLQRVSVSHQHVLNAQSLHLVTQTCWFSLEPGAYMSMRIQIIMLFPIQAVHTDDTLKVTFWTREVTYMCPSMDCHQISIKRTMTQKAQWDVGHAEHWWTQKIHTCIYVFRCLWCLFWEVPRIQHMINLECLCIFSFAKSFSSTNADVGLGCPKALGINHKWNKVDLERVQRAQRGW